MPGETFAKPMSSTHNVQCCLTDPEDLGFQVIQRKRAYRIARRHDVPALGDVAKLYRAAASLNCSWLQSVLPCKSHIISACMEFESIS